MLRTMRYVMYDYELLVVLVNTGTTFLVRIVTLFVVVFVLCVIVR